MMWDTDRQLRVWIPGIAMSKLRTRSRKGGGGVFNPPKYTQWKIEYAIKIREAFQNAQNNIFDLNSDDFSTPLIRGNIALCPFPSAKVELLFSGGMRGDPSNRLNGVLDVLLDKDLLGDCQLIYNDSTNHQPSGSYQCDKSKMVGTLIVISSVERVSFCFDKLNLWGGK
jgi:hypothetical protein